MSRLLPILIVPVLLISACASPMAATGNPQANERLACAALGIDPGSAQFGACVANLEQTEFDASNVQAR